jgi:murein DD-endopeptidase MepM/ murein hydrolase activator NlpD
MITVAVLASRTGDVDPNPGPGVEDPIIDEPVITEPEPDPPIVTNPEPIVFVSPVANQMVVREHNVNELIHWVSLNHFAVHRGVAFSGDEGTQVMAVFGGTVTRVVDSGRDQLHGNQVHIDHGDGLITVYTSMDEVNVTVGQTLTKGQVIGTMGRAGRLNEIGTHVHVEVFLNGRSIDPFLFIPSGDK